MKRKIKAPAPKAKAVEKIAPYKLQVGPVKPPYGSMLKAEGPKGTGRMK